MVQNLQKVREVLVNQLGRPVNNTDIIDALVNAWKKSNDENELEYPKTPGTYINVKKSEVNQDFFLTSVSSVSRLMDVASIHGKHCCRKLEVKKVTKRGHVVSLKLRCTRTDRAKHVYMWASSPYLPNGKYLINERINHAFVCSGMLPSQLLSFLQGSRIWGTLCIQSQFLLQ